MTLLFYPNFLGKLPPNKIGLFLIRRACTLNIKIGGELGRVELSGEGGIGDSGSYWCPRNRRLQFHPLRTFHPLQFFPIQFSGKTLYKLIMLILYSVLLLVIDL